MNDKYINGKKIISILKETTSIMELMKMTVYLIFLKVWIFL